MNVKTLSTTVKVAVAVVVRPTLSRAVTVNVLWPNALVSTLPPEATGPVHDAMPEWASAQEYVATNCVPSTSSAPCSPAGRVATGGTRSIPTAVCPNVWLSLLSDASMSTVVTPALTIVIVPTPTLLPKFPAAVCAPLIAQLTMRMPLAKAWLSVARTSMATSPAYHPSTPPAGGVTTRTGGVRSSGGSSPGSAPACPVRPAVSTSADRAAVEARLTMRPRGPRRSGRGPARSP